MINKGGEYTTVLLGSPLEKHGDFLCPWQPLQITLSVRLSNMTVSSCGAYHSTEHLHILVKYKDFHSVDKVSISITDLSPHCPTL